MNQPKRTDRGGQTADYRHIEKDDAGKVASNARNTITSQSAKDWRDRRQNPLFVVVRVDWNLSGCRVYRSELLWLTYGTAWTG